MPLILRREYLGNPHKYDFEYWNVKDDNINDNQQHENRNVKNVNINDNQQHKYSKGKIRRARSRRGRNKRNNTNSNIINSNDRNTINNNDIEENIINEHQPHKTLINRHFWKLKEGNKIYGPFIKKLFAAYKDRDIGNTVSELTKNKRDYD